jgi:hypothetical protein
MASSKNKEGNGKAHYATMMQARAGMIQSAGGKLASGATIAARYSCVRRQGFVDDGHVKFQSRENQIIDYQVQLVCALWSQRCCLSSSPFPLPHVPLLLHFLTCSTVL